MSFLSRSLAAIGGSLGIFAILGWYYDPTIFYLYKQSPAIKGTEIGWSYLLGGIGLYRVEPLMGTKLPLSKEMLQIPRLLGCTVLAGGICNLLGAFYHDHRLLGLGFFLTITLLYVPFMPKPSYHILTLGYAGV